MTSIRHLAFVLLLCLPSLAWSQVPQRGGPSQAAGNAYVLFIHAGPKKPDDAGVKDLALRLLKRGYVVRQPAFDQDVVGGPGVDYFTDQARSKAQEVADIVNDFLTDTGTPPSDARKLKPRLQNVKNPPTYLGVWLY